MKENEYDAIVIGTGQAGPSLAARLSGSGFKTAIIEKDKIGGTCVNSGCTPTKTMLASARAVYIARKATEFGVSIEGSIRVDMKKVKKRKDSLISQSSHGLENWLQNTENLSLIKGYAKFIGTNTVEVNGQQVTADKIFINVGAKAFIPQGFEDIDYLTNESILDLDYIPEHLVIVGGSYIGLELGQIFRRFGSQVTIIEKSDRLLPQEDNDVSEEVLKILELEEIQVHLNADCIKANKHPKGVAVEIHRETGSDQIVGSHILIATGRKPNTKGLGLENAGIKMDEKGYIETDEQLRTNVENVWALGDVNGRGAFTHTAYNDFEIVAANLLDGESKKVSDRKLAYALYIDPPLARVGMNESQALESGKNVLVASRPMSKIARAKEKGETNGFMKILVDADTEKILGATILGIGGDEIIHSLLDVMYSGASYKTIQRAVHIHPTVSELIPTTLGDLAPLSSSKK